MTTIINASTSSGLIQTADTSGVLQFQSNGTAAAGVSSSNFQMNSGYGSVATAYGCRAWVNFNGDTQVIRTNGNVSSISDLGAGRYGVNFSTAMPDGNYVMSGSSGNFTGTTTVGRSVNRDGEWTTTQAQIRVTGETSIYDDDYVGVVFFR